MVSDEANAPRMATTTSCLIKPLRDGARSRRRRSGIRDDQIDLCAAKLLDPARRIDLVSDELDVVARVDAELSVRPTGAQSRQR
jgi:hypothetical protein